MNLKARKRQWMGVVGGLGVAAFLLGVPGGLYGPGLAVALAFVIWIVGATLVNLLAG
ncbi:hypothetical protein HKCCSP123_15015 [Rhodobacterales bacterium HKCCSP123]|nr:hypothetical protein [Rhodobacterales bacterium HKCCSP123]